MIAREHNLHIDQPDTRSRKPDRRLHLRHWYRSATFNHLQQMQKGVDRHLLPVSIMSMAFALPTARVRRCVAPMPGITPSASSGCAAATPVCHASTPAFCDESQCTPHDDQKP